MQKSYTGNYFKIYFWNILAFTANFLSIFIVSPRITSNKYIFGIYSICMATTMFLSYADIGFMGAAYKYASECFSRNDKEGENQIIGFAAFILLLFVIVFATVIFFFSFNPGLLIKDLSNMDEISTASQLLAILAAFSPVVILRRILSTIYGIRLDDYIFSRIDLFSNLAKVFSALYFFGDGKYDIVGYFFFFQMMNLLSCIISLFIAKKKYNYDFKILLKSMRYTKPLFQKMKGLAFNSLYTSILWILYYEIDLLVLGPLAGPELTGYYAEGLLIMAYLRNLTNILNAPFVARFNHLIGNNDKEGLKTLFYKVLFISMPIIVIPILTLFLFMRPFIYTWVGSGYAPSVAVAQFLVLCFIFHFISNPVNNLLIAEVRLKSIYFIVTVNCLVYWIFIMFTYSFFGILSFAVAKFITFMLSAIFYTRIAPEFLKLKIIDIIKKFVAPMIIPILFLVGSFFIVPYFLPMEKRLLNLIVVLSVLGGLIISALFIFFVLSKEFRSQGITFIKEILRRKSPAAIPT